MIILDLELTHFGKFHRKKVELRSNVNVIYGRNEAGKSTVHSFIRGMLFGLENPRSIDADEVRYNRYFPWDNRGGYEGKMRFQTGEKVYRLERSFLKNNRYCHLYCETDDQELTPAERRLAELLDGLNETNFVNTISIEQLKSATDKGLILELQNFISNTGSSKSTEVDIENARARLEKRRDELMVQKDLDSEAKYPSCMEQLQNMNREITQIIIRKEKKEREQEQLQENLTGLETSHSEQVKQHEDMEIAAKRQYESALQELYQAPDVDETDLDIKNYGAIMFLILGFLFVGGAAAMYVLSGANRSHNLIELLFSAVALGMFLLSAYSKLTFKGKKRKIKQDYERRMDATKYFQKIKRNMEEVQKGAPVLNVEKHTALSAELESIQEQLAALAAEEDAKSQKAAEYNNEQERLLAVLEENASIQEEIDAVNLALEIIGKITDRVHDTFGNRLNREASVLLSEITNGKYNRISVDDEMKVRIHTEERDVPLESVSRGTVEQIYLCIRIAAANLLWQKAPMPFLFDDVFAYYDDERMENAMKLLKNCGHQVIIFSCHTREKNLV